MKHKFLVHKRGDHVGVALVDIDSREHVPLTGNPKTATTMSGHIDLDVGDLLSRDLTLEQAGEQLLDLCVLTANGRLTCAETLGHREFVLTRL